MTRSRVVTGLGAAAPGRGGGRAATARPRVRHGAPHRPAGRFVAGCHDEDFWRQMLPAQVHFVGRTLAA
jgi:hypothetical protein